MLVLDRTSNKIFKYIYKYPKNQSLSSLKCKFKDIEEYRIFDSYEILIKEKLIKNYNGAILITNKGKDYYFDFWINKFKYFFSLIVIPIIVSYIITSLNINENQCSNQTYNYYNTDIKK